MKTKTIIKLQNKSQFFWTLIYPLCYIILFVLLFISNSFSQSVGIGATNFTPDASAILELSSPDKGFLITRISTAEMNAIASPATGLMVYNTDCNTINYYNGTTWVAIGNNGSVSTPGAVSGNTTPCQNATGISYSIAAVSGATGYNWVVPSGATVLTGQGTTSITVNYGTGNGNVCVYAYNACGSSAASCTAITLLSALPAAGSISGTSAVCQNQNGVNYSVGAIAGATGYAWTYTGTGFSIATGSNTNSITANFSGAATTGNLIVYGTHVCGNSTPSSAYTVTVNMPPTTANAGSDINPSCGVTTATLAGNTPSTGTGAWSVVSGTATITSPNSPTSGVTGLAITGTATLRWTISNSPCASSTDDVVITTNACCTPGSVTDGSLVKTTICDNGYTVIKWTYSSSPGTTTWTVPSGVTQVQYLVVAGGGAGGGSPADQGGQGGGGAGGYLSGNLTITTNPLTVIVGAGGTGSAGTGMNGNNSSLGATISAIGGGGGAEWANNGRAGGSGGGGAGLHTSTTSGGDADYLSPRQGYDGGGNGGAMNPNYPGGGGGGASHVGYNGANTSVGGNGGNGIASNITGSSVYYAGGGGACNRDSGTDGIGGTGGGGNGNSAQSGTGGAGTANTGGGGGAGHNIGGNGGSGIVIIRYLIP